MDKRSAEKAYGQMKKNLDRGRLTREQFIQQVADLRYQDASGVWYQIRPEDGSWLRWDGTQWIPVPSATIRSTSPKASKQGKKEPLGEPETLFQLGVLIVKGVVQGLVRRLGWMAALAVGVWVLHTYLLAGPNNGFWKVTTVWLGMILALRGRMVGGTLFWMLAFGLAATIFTLVRTWGMGGFLKRLGSVPREIRRARSRVPQQESRILLAAAAVSLIPAALIGNRLVSLLAAAGVYLSLTQGFNGFLFLVVRLGWSDLARWFHWKGLNPFRPAAAYLVIAGLAAGLLVGAVLPYHPYSGLIAAFALVVLAVTQKKTAVQGLSCLLFCIVLLTVRQAFGHDGGAYEAGGWERWLGSTGALTAVLHGLPPAFGAVLGTVLGAGALQGIQPPETTTRILSGAEALEWLQDPDRGLMVDGVLTDRFWNSWYNQLGGGNPYGLGAIAGEWDPDDRNRRLEDITIVVEDMQPAEPVKVDDVVDTDSTGSGSDPDTDTSDDGNDTDQPPVKLDEGTEPVKEDEGGPKAPPPEEKPPESKPPQGPKLDENGMPVGIKPRDYLTQLMNQIVQDRAGGENGPRYWVTNRDISRLNLGPVMPGRPIIQFFTSLINYRVTRPVMEYLAGWQGGTCGDFAEWGMHWVGDDLRRTFGNGVYVEQIVLQRNSMINHAATKVILPNGERYVMDFWDGIQDRKPHMYTEQEWLNKWKPQLGGNPQVTSVSYMESQLKNLVSILGNQEEAFEMFLDSNKNSPQAQTLIKSFRRNPW